MDKRSLSYTKQGDCMWKKLSYLFSIIIMIYTLCLIAFKIPLIDCMNQLKHISIFWFFFIIFYLFVMLLLDIIPNYFALQSLHDLSFIKYLCIEVLNHLLEQISFAPIADSVLLTKQYQLSIPVSHSLCVLLWERYLHAFPHIFLHLLPFLFMKDWLFEHVGYLYLPGLSVVLGLIILLIGNALLLWIPSFQNGKFQWLLEVNHVLINLMNKKKLMFLYLVNHFLYCMMKHSILIWCAWMLHLPLNLSIYIRFVMLSLFMDCIMMIIPMIGKHGIAEGVFLLVFSSIYSQSTLFSMLLLWRMMTYYLPLIFYLFLYLILKFYLSNH